MRGDFSATVANLRPGPNYLVLPRPLADAVRDGRKTQHREPIQDGSEARRLPGDCLRAYAAHPATAGAWPIALLTVESAVLEPLGAMTGADAEAEGYPGLLAFRDGWTLRHGRVWRPDERVLVLRFALGSAPARPLYGSLSALLEAWAACGACRSPTPPTEPISPFGVDAPMPAVGGKTWNGEARRAGLALLASRVARGLGRTVTGDDLRLAASALARRREREEPPAPRLAVHRDDLLRAGKTLALIRRAARDLGLIP